MRAYNHFSQLIVDSRIALCMLKDNLNLNNSYFGNYIPVIKEYTADDNIECYLHPLALSHIILLISKLANPNAIKHSSNDILCILDRAGIKTLQDEVIDAEYGMEIADVLKRSSDSEQIHFVQAASVVCAVRNKYPLLTANKNLVGLGAMTIFIGDNGVQTIYDADGKRLR